MLEVSLNNEPSACEEIKKDEIFTSSIQRNLLEELLSLQAYDFAKKLVT